MKHSNDLNNIYFISYFIKKFIKKFLMKKKDKLKSNFFKFHQSKLFKIRENEKKNLIILVCLESFENYFTLIWIYIARSLRLKKYSFLALSLKKNNTVNKILKFGNIKIIYLDEEIIKLKKTHNYKRKLNIFENKCKNLKNFKDYYNFKINNLIIGRWAISNFCRIHKVGYIDYNSKLQKFDLDLKLKNIFNVFLVMNEIINLKKPKFFFMTEKNLDSYVGVFMSALFKNKEIINWHGSNVSVDSFILKKITIKNYDQHHSSLSPPTWKKIKKEDNKKKLNKINKNFLLSRYYNSTPPFSRNLLNVKKYSKNEIKEKYSIKNNLPNVIIFSHILHDLIFFFGKEIYKTYSEWLIETVKLSCKNKKVNWFIKFHPSNIYRGEFKDGFSKEEEILKKFVKKLPSHIKLVYPNTKINPLSWMNFADMAVTVRGTSGLEMASMGKTVITTGSNRYENKGFTIDPKNKNNYRKIMLNLSNNYQFKNKSKNNNANKYLFGIFSKKLFYIDFLKIDHVPKLFNWDDIISIPSHEFKKKSITKNLILFEKFLRNKTEIDFLR